MSGTLERRVQAARLKRQALDEVDIAPEGYLIGGRIQQWEAARSALEARGGRARGYYDAFGQQKRPEHAGLPVYTPGRFPFPSDTPVLFAGKPRKAWFNDAARPGMQTCTWQEPLDKKRRRGRHMPRLLDERRQQLQRFHDLLADETSRRTLSALVRARVEGDTGYIEISQHPEYLHPVAAPQRGDVVVDAGAFDGDTAQVFSRRVGPEGRVLSLEPSFANYIQLAKVSQQSQYGNVIPLCVAAWNRPTCLSFDVDTASGGSNRASSDGGNEVVATTIDRLARNHSLSRLDVIKLDVEGAEAEAIEGAWQAIRRYRPSLHVSIYHKPYDLVDLPLMLANRLTGYRFYLGHHSHYHTETDLYAVPLERGFRLRAKARKLLRSPSAFVRDALVR